MSVAHLYSGTVPREPGGQPRAGRRGLGTPLRLAGIGACGLALLVSVTALAGGLDEVPEASLPAVAVDEVDRGEPWNLTVSRAVLARDLSPAVLQEDTNHWLAIVATVEVTSSESRLDIGDALYLTGVEGLVGDSHIIGIDGSLRSDDRFLMRDGLRVSALHPGLPEEVAFLWEQAADAPVPAELEVRLVGMTRRENTMNGHMEWLDPVPRARVTVPVTDRRDEL